jgi:hypothetical protein
VRTFVFDSRLLPLLVLTFPVERVCVVEELLTDEELLFVEEERKPDVVVLREELELSPPLR